MNRPTSQRKDSTFPGEEMVPDGYDPPELSGQTLSVWRSLFGADPDRAYLNFRLRQYLGMIHSGDLARYADRFGTKLTYISPDGPWFNDDSLFRAPYVEQRQVTDSRTAVLVFSGRPAADDAAGRIHQTWWIAVAADSISYLRTDVNEESDYVAVSFPDGMSQPVPLPGSGLSVSAPELAVSRAFEVELLARPNKDLTVVLAEAARMVGGGDLFFRAADPAGDGLLQIWKRRYETPVRLAALVLALAHNIEALE